MPDPSPSPSDSFGADLAARARPRVRAAGPGRGSSSVGALGRSTLGFGRIIATAGSARPTVTPDVLATRSLRPPVWTLGAEADEQALDHLAPVEPWTTRALTARARSASARRPTAAPARTAPPAAPTLSRGPRPAAPGNGKLDALRRLLEARGEIEPAAPAPNGERGATRDVLTSGAAPDTPARAARPVAATDPGDRTATSAGPTTAPGQFGRRVRPEPTESPLASVFPETPVRPTAPPAGSRVDRLRRTLEARGVLAPSSDDEAPERTRARTERPTARRAGDHAPSGGAAAPAPRTSPPTRRSTPGRSTTARPEPAAGDADADGPRGAEPSRGLPLALTPERAPLAPSPPRRAIEPQRDAASRGPRAAADAVAPGAPIAGTRVDPVGRATSPTPSDAAPERMPTGPADIAARAAISRVAPAPDGSLAPAVISRSPAEDRGALPSPAAVVDRPRSADRVARRRTELRTLGGRIGLDRTLVSVDAPRPPSLPSASAREDAPAGPRPLDVPTAISPAAVHRVAVTGPDASRGPTPEGATEPGAMLRRVPGGDPAPGARRLAAAPPAGLPRGAVGPDAARTVVVTRARDARRAGEVVRRRIAGHRFADHQHGDGLGTGGPTPPDLAAIGRPSSVPRSIVAAGPGALQRALLRTDDRGASVDGRSEPTTAPIAAAPVPRTTANPTPFRPERTPGAAPAPTAADPTRPRPALAVPGPTRAAPTTPAASAPVPSAVPDPARAVLATPAAPAAHPPAVPDPATVAAVTADRLAAPRPELIPDHATSGGAPTASPATGPTTATIHRAPAPAPVRDDLGARFLRELGRAPDRGARELPAPFRPLATAITGSADRIRVASDAVTRRALAAVDKQAVTVGDTIHVARAPRPDARTTEVLAHELVHVAHPSPIPRFFDDDHRGPEERMAERVAGVIARSPVMPSAPVPSSPVPSPAAPASHAAGDVVRRAPSTSRPAGRGSSGSGTISAADLADALEGRHTAAGITSATASAATSSSTIRRAPAPTSTLAPTGDGAETDRSAPVPNGDPPPMFGSGTREEREWFERLVEQSIEQIVRRVEERVIVDLERRGGRFWRTL